MNINNFIKAYWRAISWGVLIVILSSLSGNTMNSIPMFNIPHIDKVGHAGFYAVLTFFILYGQIYYNSLDRLRLKNYLLSLAIVLVMGGIMEIMQRYVFIKRSADWADFAANTTGCLLAIFLYYPILPVVRWMRIVK
jgi:VanZ family protein